MIPIITRQKPHKIIKPKFVQAKITTHYFLNNIIKSIMYKQKVNLSYLVCKIKLYNLV